MRAVRAVSAFFVAPHDAAGVAVVRGMVAGAAAWILFPLTLSPLLAGADPAWTVEAARERFGLLPALALGGAGLCLLAHALARAATALFADDPGHGEVEGFGAEGLRALAAGALAGLVGGAVFTFVMLQIGFLPVVASLVGVSSALAGLALHLVIAQLIGAAYGLLFRRQSLDATAALGWGVSYGLLLWLLGPLTLLPVLLGGPPQWSAAAATAVFASLIGHLAYGAALGIVFQRLESRYNPWWMTRTDVQAERAQRRAARLSTSGPVLWALVVLVTACLPVLLGA